MIFDSTNMLTYFVFVVPALILSIIAEIRVKSAYSKYSQIANSQHITGQQAAQAVLGYYGINDVTIERCSGTLTDHYHPRQKVIRLSEGVYDSCSIAAVGIACHEAGHAAQHANHYIPIRIRNMILPACNIGSRLGIPLALIGCWLAIEPLVYVGVLLYSFIMLFQFVTLPVELNASRRAIACIDKMGMFTDSKEMRYAKKVLKSAAMTYVAALAVSFGNLLRLLAMLNRRKR